MFGKKYNLCVGLTTFNNEMLMISVSALSRIRNKFLLVVCNDNSTTTVSRHQIRRLGYHGPLMIINNDENMGMLRARMEIVKVVAKLKHIPQWIIFNDDDDMIINLDVPKTSPDIFAIIQNRAIVRHRVCDMLRIMANPDDCITDDENIILEKPHVGFSGILLRTRVVIDFIQVLETILPQIKNIDDNLTYVAPTDTMMWNMLNTYVHRTLPNALPVYMDKINYVAINLDSAPMKYGRIVRPPRNADEHYARVMAKYDAAIRTAMELNNEKETENDL